MTTRKVYFDREPTNAITAEQVREQKRACDCKETTKQAGECDHGENAFRFVLRGLLAHPGVSSSARAVIEAALE